MSERKIDPAIIFVAIISILVVGIGVFIYTQIRTDEISLRAEAGELVPVLIMVTKENQPVLSNVLFVQPQTKKIALVDVPENLGSIIGSLGRVDSFDVLYREKGVEEYRAQLSKLIGQKIDYYMVMTLDQAKTTVDLLNGFPVYMADSMDVNDKNALMRIPSGDVILDGDKATGLISYHASNERDQERSNRRWAFTKALVSRLGEAPVSNGKFMQLIVRQMNSNLDERTLASLATLLSEVDVNTMITQRVVGNTRIVDTQDGSKSLLFPHFEGQLLKDSLRQVITTLSSNEDPKDSASIIRVEILNGTALSGLAKRTKDLFQSYGFEVVSLGNSPATDVSSTQVIDRKGNPALADKVAKVIKCDKVITQIEAGTNQDIDVTVILGKDFDGISVKSN